MLTKPESFKTDSDKNQLCFTECSKILHNQSHLKSLNFAYFGKIYNHCNEGITHWYVTDPLLCMKQDS